MSRQFVVPVPHETDCRPVPALNFFSTGFNTFSANWYLFIQCVRSPVEETFKGQRSRATGHDRPHTLAGRPLKDQPRVEAPERRRDACNLSTLGGFVPRGARSSSTETGEEKPSLWRIMREALEAATASPRLPPLAEREPPTAVLLAPEPLHPPKEPQHSLPSVMWPIPALRPRRKSRAHPGAAYRHPARAYSPAVARHLPPQEET